MAIPEKGSRVITVNAIRMRWAYVSKGPHLMNGKMFLIAQHEQGQKLSVDLGIVQQEHSDKYGRPERHILPGLVSKLLKAAMAKGWMPLKKTSGVSFTFKELLPNESLPPRWKDNPEYYRDPNASKG